MEPTRFHLAQANVARMLAPLDSPIMDTLKSRGPTAEAFTFRTPVPPDGRRPLAPPDIDAEFCDWAT
jgi:hypothetical protein